MWRHIAKWRTLKAVKQNKLRSFTFFINRRKGNIARRVVIPTASPLVCVRLRLHGGSLIFCRVSAMKRSASTPLRDAVVTWFVKCKKYFTQNHFIRILGCLYPTIPSLLCWVNLH